MNISEAASQAGLNAKAIRHYEDQGILPKAKRSESGYRVYDAEDVHLLRFVHRSRTLGFSLAEIKQLVSLWKNKRRRSEDVKTIAETHIKVLDQKIQELLSLKSALEELSELCQGGDRPDCPILDELSNPTR